MNANKRIMALRLMEKQKRHPDFAGKLGVEVRIIKSAQNENYQKCK